MRLPLLVIHIGAGIIGLLSGAAAMAFRKGSHRHRMAGNVFFISMLTLSASAAYLGYMKHQMGNVFGGLLTFYLVATAWVTARRRDGETGIFDWVALAVVLAVGAVIMSDGLEVAQTPTGSRNGVPAGMILFLGSVALLAAAGDVRMIARGGLSGAQRIARHLWRMCFGLFIASGSFFIGQPQVFPAFLRKTNMLFLLGVLPLLLMIFWIVRVRFTNAYAKSVPSAGDVYSLRT